MASGVWADTAHRSATSLPMLAKRAIVPHLQRPEPRGKVRAAVEPEPPRTTAEAAQHALALQQGVERPTLPLRHGLFVYADAGELVEFDAAP